MKNFTRLANGNLPAETWPGRHPVLYFTYEKHIICASCANGGCGSQYTPETTDTRWLIVDQFVFVDGDPIECSYCDTEVLPVNYVIKDNREEDADDRCDWCRENGIEHCRHIGM